MPKKARSAMGQIVDFDYLSIKQQLASAPVPVSVNQRRKFIDEKDGIKTKEVKKPVVVEEPQKPVGALSVAAEAAEESSKAAK